MYAPVALIDASLNHQSICLINLKGNFRGLKEPLDEDRSDGNCSFHLSTLTFFQFNDEF